jgi:hypothetical protein
MSGDYVLEAQPEAGLVKVYFDEDQLYLQRPSQLPIPLYPAAPDTVLHHFFNGMDLTLTFQRNPSGQATGAQGAFSFKPYDISVPYNLARSAASASNTSPISTGWWIGIGGAGLVLMALGSFLVVLRRRHTAHP